jgi:type IV pilus assembly protein PilW
MSKRNHAGTIRVARPTRLHSRGFTLVELMVAIALGLFVITVVVQGFAATSAASNTNSVVAESSTNGRHALEELKREVRHAALHRLVWDASQIVNDDATLATKDYGCGAGFVTGLGVGITGFNDNNPYAASCLSTASDRAYARGDVLVLRRTSRAPASSFDIGAPYVRMAYGVANVFIGATTTDEPLLPEPHFDYRMVSDVYFVNSFTNSANETPRVPALYRLTLSSGANPQMKPELVASNVEQFQVQYAVADGSGNIRYFDANAVTDWTAVRTARIWLLTRESTAEPGFVSGEYVMGDVTYKPADNFRRNVYSSTIAIRNN